LVKKVLVVDDSALVRRVLAEEISQCPDFQVVGSAVDPYDAREKIFQLEPDILTLDLDMPRMDGLSFLTRLMKFHPMPVVVVSSHAQEGSKAALDALEIGALEIVPKPGPQFSVPDVHRTLIQALRAASAVDLKKLDMNLLGANPDLRSPISRHVLKSGSKVVAIGASTGGTQAIEAVLRRMPADGPGAVIVQHMPAAFTRPFAERLNKSCSMRVCEARDFDEIKPGVALIAPGDRHMVLTRNGSHVQVRIKNGPRVHFQRPSVDVLFRSVAANLARNAIGVLLTGMGADGASGLQQMHDRGAHTIAQDEKSSVVFGMPREAIALGCVDEVLSLEHIGEAILDQCCPE
jgi:two-component system, chemotaxis family, protein-glutamate methylesterase/glutaminase